MSKTTISATAVVILIFGSAELQHVRSPRKIASNVCKDFL